jgi:hypothetical protein
MNVYSKHVSLLLASSSVIHRNSYPYEKKKKNKYCNNNQQRELPNINSNEDHKTRPQEGIFLCLRRRRRKGKKMLT